MPGESNVRWKNAAITAVRLSALRPSTRRAAGACAASMETSSTCHAWEHHVVRPCNAQRNNSANVYSDH